MKRLMTATLIASAAVIAALGSPGSAGAARCGGPSDGYVDPRFPDGTDTWDSPGEVVTYFISELDRLPTTFQNPAGQTVKLLCAGAPATD